MKSSRQGAVSWVSLTVILAIGGGLAALAVTAQPALQSAPKFSDESSDATSDAGDAVSIGAAGSTSAAGSTEEASPHSDSAAKLFPVTIQSRSGPEGIPTGEFDRLGHPVMANCTTCHTAREPNKTTSEGAQLKDFHQGLVMNHGSLKCVSCHNPDDYSQLRLASGETLAFEDSMQLCAQCHGTQYRDYKHGAHGGMTGYWDLTRGPRTRNHCLACHDAHAPPYAQVMPVFPPDDHRHPRPPAPSVKHAPVQQHASPTHATEEGS